MTLQETLMWIVEAINKSCSLSENVLCCCYVWYICVPSNLGIFIFIGCAIVYTTLSPLGIWDHEKYQTTAMMVLFFSNRLRAFESLSGFYCLYNIASIDYEFFLLDDKYNHTASLFYSIMHLTIELNIIGKKPTSLYINEMNLTY